MKSHVQPWLINSDDFPGESFASDQLEFLLGYATLAPSTHNSQPWRFRINATDVEILADWSRLLKVVDPQGRELIMSCGAALYNLRIAAEYFEKEYQLTPFPDPTQHGLLARFELGLHAETGSEDLLLFHAITQRRTNREPFLDRPIPEELLDELVAVAEEEGAWLRVADDDDTRGALAKLVAEADRRQWADRHFRQELASWIRKRPEEGADGLPAHQLGVSDWLSFAGPSLIRTFNRGKGQAARDEEIATHSPMLVVLGTEADDRAAWLTAGQALQRLLLRARSEEVWASFLCQPLEIPELREQVAQLCGQPHPQVLLRLGYGPSISPTPRRPVHGLLVQHDTMAHENHTAPTLHSTARPDAGGVKRVGAVKGK